MLLAAGDDLSEAARVLSRGDLTLREADVKLLRSPDAWLNDHLLTFRFQRLAESLGDDSVALLDASVGYFLSQLSPEEAHVVAEPLRLSTRKLVVTPLSDSKSPGVALGGSHWTLLAFWPDAGKSRCCVYDSLGGERGSAEARAVAAALATACGLQSTPPVETPSCPRQANASDCGLHVLLTAEAVCTAHAADGAPPSAEQLARFVTPEAASALRRSMLADIYSLAASAADDWPA
jgi:sentrin-specific protease 8